MRQQRRLHAFDERAQKRQRAAGRLGRVIGALDRVGDLVDEEAADKGGHRRHQEHRAGDDAEPGHDREHPGERAPGRVVGVTGSLFGPVGAGLRQREQQPVQQDADQDDEQQAQARPPSAAPRATAGVNICDKALPAASNMRMEVVVI